MKKVLTLLVAMVMTMAGQAQKYVGGDISLLTEYEQRNATYFDYNGTRITDVLSFMKEQGMNAMRVRLFVDPTKAPQDHRNQGARQDLAYVKALGKRIKTAGLAFMLDLHYSDTWTDPGKHSTPSGWPSTATELAQRVYDYTVEVLTELNADGATPDFIQVGNEVSYGMLWPTGHVYPGGGGQDGGTWQNFAQYIIKGVEACHAVCPKAKTVVHVELSHMDNADKFFAQLNQYTTDYDIIGLSYYPYYHGDITDFDNALSTLESHYPTKGIQIVETGYFHAYYPQDAKYNYTSKWPATEAGQKQFTADLVTTLNRHSKVTGLYWWWPETCEKGIDWRNAVTPSGWYNAGLWDNETGRAMSAITELVKFAPSTAISATKADIPQASPIYDLQGRPITSRPSVPGIYVSNGRKVVIR